MSERIWGALRKMRYTNRRILYFTLLWVLLISDISFDKQVTTVSAKCFDSCCAASDILSTMIQPLGLLWSTRSTPDGSIDYCSCLLIGATKKTTDKLQRVINAAAIIVSNTRKYDRWLSRFRRDKLHWLDVDDRVRFSVRPGVQESVRRGTRILDVTLPIGSVDISIGLFVTDFSTKDNANGVKFCAVVYRRPGMGGGSTL